MATRTSLTRSPLQERPLPIGRKRRKGRTRHPSSFKRTGRARRSSSRAARKEPDERFYFPKRLLDVGRQNNVLASPVTIAEPRVERDVINAQGSRRSLRTKRATIPGERGEPANRKSRSTHECTISDLREEVVAAWRRVRDAYRFSLALGRLQPPRRLLKTITSSAVLVGGGVRRLQSPLPEESSRPF